MKIRHEMNDGQDCTHQLSSFKQKKNEESIGGFCGCNRHWKKKKQLNNPGREENVRKFEFKHVDILS